MYDINNQSSSNKKEQILVEAKKLSDLSKIIGIIKENKSMYYYLDKNHFIIYNPKESVCYTEVNVIDFKDIFEDENILKVSFKQKDQFLLLWKKDINPKNMMFDIEIAAYLLNSNINKYTIEYVSNEYLRVRFK